MILKHDPVIYRIRNKNNGKMYFGQTVNFQRRMNEYKNRRSEGYSKYHIMEILDKEGRENFEFTIMEHCPRHLLNEREAYYIKKHNTTNPLFGYNSQKGEKDKRMFKRTREKMRLSHIGLKESAITKRKKSKPVLAISLQSKIVYYADSLKILSDNWGIKKEKLRRSLHKMHKINNFYIIFYNKNDQYNFLKNKIIIDSEFKKVISIAKESVETIEKQYNLIRIEYID